MYDFAQPHVQVLQGDIVPSIDVLRQQCGQYNEWAKKS